MSDRTIVGVVGDIRVRGLERTSEPQVYLPYKQQPDDSFSFYVPKDLVVRATTPLDQLAPAVRSIVRMADPQQPVSDLRPMTDVIDAETASRSVQVRVLAGFAFVAFLLAAIGIHGVLSFAVSQRTPEIGVRLALGAQRRDILGMVMRQGVLLVAAGLLPGLLLAYWAGRSLQTLLTDLTRRHAHVRQRHRTDAPDGARRHAAPNAARLAHRPDQGDPFRVDGDRRPAPALMARAGVVRRRRGSWPDPEVPEVVGVPPQSLSGRQRKSGRVASEQTESA